MRHRRKISRASKRPSHSFSPPSPPLRAIRKKRFDLQERALHHLALESDVPRPRLEDKSLTYGPLRQHRFVEVNFVVAQQGLDVSDLSGVMNGVDGRSRDHPTIGERHIVAE